MRGVAEGSGGTGINFGSNNQFRDVKVDGTVAGRDITQTTTGAGAEGAFDLQQLQSVLTELQAALDQLPDAPAGDVEDARDELRKAGEAAQQGDTDRTVKK